MKRYMEYLGPLCVLITLIILGIFIYQDYGIPWDEDEQIRVGAINYRYMVKGDTELFSFRDRYYGGLYETVLLWLTVRFAIPRHLCIFLTFIVGLALLFLLSKRLFKSAGWALFTVMLLAVSPRIFADAFYNSKDIPFMVFSIACIWSLFLLADSLEQAQRWSSVIFKLGFHALVSGVLIGTRVPGIMIIPLSVFLILTGIFKDPSMWKKYLAVVIGYLLLTVGFTILCWPILWHAPWTEFKNAFIQMSQYPFDRPVLYWGQFFSPDNLPWHYLWVWIGITTPLVVLSGFVATLLLWIRLMSLSIRSWVRNPTGNFFEQVDPDFWAWLVILGWLALPIVAIYWFHSVLYDGWRQMFFVYPAIVLISVWGIKDIFLKLFRLKKSLSFIRFVVGILIVAGLFEPVWFMVRNHPYENVYFNILAGNPATLRQRFELDYWGLSYKQAIDYVLANDSRQEIILAIANPPGEDYVNVGLSPVQKSRLLVTHSLDDADYFVTEFRWHPQDYPYADEFYSISVRGTKIMAVYRLP